MNLREDVIGQKFGRLTVIKSTGVGADRKQTVEVKCECGKIKEVRLNNIKNGTTKSCGCIPHLRKING